MLPLSTTGMHVTPFFAVEPIQVHLDAASESFGAAGAGLRYHATDVVAGADLAGCATGRELDGTKRLDSGAVRAAGLGA